MIRIFQVFDQKTTFIWDKQSIDSIKLSIEWILRSMNDKKTNDKCLSQNKKP
jgi:hypothetical protein